MIAAKEDPTERKNPSRVVVNTDNSLSVFVKNQTIELATFHAVLYPNVYV